MNTVSELAGRIMVALDYPDGQSAKGLLERLKGIPCYVKVGMELFYASGPSFIGYLKENGYSVFLDLKMHDIPNTIKGGAKSVTRLGVDMFNIHAAGGMRMMAAAMEGVDEGVSGGSNASKPQVIAVTQLTSTDERMLNDEIGIAGTVEAAVLRYARLANQAGLAGVVASPREVESIKRELGASFVAVTPGIRPAGSDQGDQSRVMTPKEAFAQGSDYIVIGRPITASPDPREALERIIESCL